jgi:hypothetical protein
MEGGGSFRIGSSSIWRNSDADEIFSNSFHQEDDEEALKWAAIQKLPTFARLRKGLLTSLQGEATEIDIEKLGLQERKDLLERLVRLAEEDNEKFLLKLKDRIDRFKFNYIFVPLLILKEVLAAFEIHWFFLLIILFLFIGWYISELELIFLR